MGNCGNIRFHGKFCKILAQKLVYTVILMSARRFVSTRGKGNSLTFVPGLS